MQGFIFISSFPPVVCKQPIILIYALVFYFEVLECFTNADKLN